MSLRVNYFSNFCFSALLISFSFFSANLFSHTQEAQFTGDQVLDPSLPWWEAGDSYAYSVSIDGDTAAVGASREEGQNVGYVYIYVRDSGGNWTQQAKISNPGAAANFGRKIALHNDTLLVAAIAAGDYQGTGSAHIFVRDGSGNWTLEANLAGDSNNLDGFGFSGDLYENTAVVGAWHDDDQGPNSGAVHVFVRDGTTWTREAKLYSSDMDINDHFGRALTLEGDTLAVNSMMDLNPAGLYAGNAYVFVRQDGAWVEQAKLEASDGNGADNMGLSLDINGDYLVAGAFGDDAVGGNNRGSAYVFRRNNCTWVEDAKLEPNKVNDNMNFGQAIAIQGDVIIVGAPGDDDLGDRAGAAYIFSRDSGSWIQDSKILPSISSSIYGDDGIVRVNFGAAIDLSDDKSVIGALNYILGDVYMHDLDTDNVAYSVQDKICFDGCHP
ncbi:MAG: hypothetical protein VYA80_05060 [Pseudomonadota bacterium]|nr:hypothetical protein [Pseudomonadota bacterium]